MRFFKYASVYMLGALDTEPAFLGISQAFVFRFRQWFLIETEQAGKIEPSAWFKFNALISVIFGNCRFESSSSTLNSGSELLEITTR